MRIRTLAFGKILSMLLLCAAVAPVYAQSPAPKDSKISAKAREHFNAGVAYIDDPSGSKWEEAYKEFHTAYTDSKSWRILNNIGVCALNLERDEEAIWAYQQYLQLGGKEVSEKNRAQVEKDIAMLKASLAIVTITVDLADAKLADERTTASGGLVINRYAIQGNSFRLGIHPGHHKFSVSVPGGQSVMWEFDADPGSSQNHEFRLVKEDTKPAAVPVSAEPVRAKAQVTEPPKIPAQGTPTLVYVGAAATGVFAVAATITGVMALSKQSDFNHAKDAGRVSQAQDLKDSGERFALVTDIGIGAAVVCAGITAYAYFTAPSAAAEKPAASLSRAERATGRSQWQVAPLAGVNVGGLSLTGQF